jgi:hypothetical protein
MKQSDLGKSLDPTRWVLKNPDTESRTYILKEEFFRYFSLGKIMQLQFLRIFLSFGHDSSIVAVLPVAVQSELQMCQDCPFMAYIIG